MNEAELRAYASLYDYLKQYDSFWRSVKGERKERRKDGFLPCFEPFRRLNENERLCVQRLAALANLQGPLCSTDYEDFQISYQALTGGFTICNIIVNGKLYSGSSHCSKVDQWLPIRGQMLAFKRALESTGIALPVNLPNGDSEF